MPADLEEDMRHWDTGHPGRNHEVAKCFRYARREQVLQLLETLDGLGLVRAAGDGAYAG